ncbi:MAG: vitamin B12-dependent ribonucleotide reductase [Desulfobacteraceae bacterium]|nr:vitamin B12-dependent ribonucleotide reductase [Desulfobacteraceae bacterium]
MALSLAENAKIILEKRYLKKDGQGKVIEKPEDLFKRVSKTIADADKIFDPEVEIAETENAFHRMLTEFCFLPNSPTLMNAGRRLGQLAACFVLPVEDSMESIFETLKHAAMIHKSGGGTGFSFSKIRPKDDIVLSTAGISSGPLSFMKVYDMATETVKQGGTRRGANMGILRVDHPDIEAFIDVKNQQDRLNNFNISVAITDAFMGALEKDSDYDIINPRSGKIFKKLSAPYIFNKIVTSAWNSGEPGVLFIDRINEFNPTPNLGNIESTNPCGEQPLLPYESCTLGSINLAKMVSGGKVDLKKLKATIGHAIHFLDNVIEVNRYPLKKIEDMSKGNRKIGLGVMGFADLLIKLGIPYDSDEAVVRAEDIMSFIQKESKTASATLAKKRGNFSFYSKSRYDRPDTLFMRNATTTTIAPTGTISLLADTSSGIEPIFAVCHTRHVLDGKTLIQTHPLFVQLAKEHKFYSKQLIMDIAEKGSVQHLAEIPHQIKELFKTSHEISAQQHVRIQSAFQKHTDNAVSKTINFPNSASENEIRQAYIQAYQSGCKGLTIYRYGSRDKQVLNIGEKSPETLRPCSSEIVPRPRPERTSGMTQRITTGCGNLYVTVNYDEQGMCEVFAQMGKTGGCASSQIEAAGRLASLALRSGIKVDAIIKQLVGIRCPSPAWRNGGMVLSCPDAIAHVLKNVTHSELSETGGMLGVCPECGNVLVHAEGCMVCHSCGFSKCS